MTKKIGIITWHYLENYGSALQAFALQKTIENMGHDVEIINYREGAKINFSWNIMRWFRNSFLYRFLDKRKHEFYKFHNKNFSQTKLISTYEELKNIATKFDYIVCGSDQIWAPNRLNMVYMLNFVEEKKKRISYAPSLVIDNYTDNQKKLIKIELEKFKAISLREKYGVSLINKITGLKAKEVLDPTLLLPLSEYKKIEKQTKIKGKYILVYLLGENQEHRKLIKKIAEREKMKIVTLPLVSDDLIFGEYILKKAGPSEFLGLISNSTMIYTDSYHGVLLSLKYNKQFKVLKRFKLGEKNNQNERIFNILKKLNLENRILETAEDKIGKIDYKKINVDLKKYIQRSLNFLESNLEVSKND